MPAKYSHVKKRSASGLLKKAGNAHVKDAPHHYTRVPNPHIDRSISKAMTAVSQLERGIARILLIRYEQDIARLFSTRLYSIALIHLPTFVMRCISLTGPSWLVYNHDCEEIKDFFRAAISMDMRQAGERVATKSVLWSYTALRHFAMSNNVSICAKRGLHSLRLLEYYPALIAHVDALEAMPPPVFSKPPHLGSLQEGQEALEDACELKYRLLNDQGAGGWDKDWRAKVRLGYERLAQTLWKVAREFDVRGYGMVLREKLTSKWCDCGCSTDHLGEVCERTVREEEEESGVRVGKQREWDGRGSGVYGWETEEEEDIWEVELDFGGMDPDASDDGVDSEMTIGEIMEWRFFKAEQEKEEGNIAFRQGDFKKAVNFYEIAHDIEPELPHYQLNLAAAHLKLCNWMEAEKACTKALSQHRSSKGYYRRARARRMLKRPDEAIRDLRAVLKLQPKNVEAIAELASLLPPERPSPKPKIKKPVIPAASSASSSSIPLALSPSSSSSSKPGPNPGDPTAADSKRRRAEQGKQPPWPRSKLDERRLKVVLIPASAAEMAFEEYGRQYARQAAAAAGCTYPNSVAGKNGKGKSTAAAAAASGKRPVGKAGSKTKSSRIKEMEEIMRAETVVYPSWDRACTIAGSSPDIPPFVTVKPGETFKIECVDWTGAQIGNNDTSDDVRNVDLTKVHNLSGPIGVEGAEPGDCLVVDILDINYYDKMPWGYTGIFELENGGGLLAKEFNSKAAKAIWDLKGVYATSRHIPGVRFAGVTHPGIVGTAPSAELLAKWNERERGLIAQNASALPPVAYSPEPKGSYVGQDLSPELREKIAQEGARTIPGREHGGNCDIKNLSKGSRCYLPVFVPGANFSVGDLHFSQGDGEAGIVTFSTSIIKGGVEKFALKQPIFLPSPIDPLYTSQVVFEGISVDIHGDGKQYDMDTTVAFKQAALNAIAYLQKVGYTREQAYLLLSAAPIESHVGAIVDSPNACVTLGIPTGIFEHDILPRPEGFAKRDFGQCAIRSDGVV
ncbi:hypothetical protein D9615_005795 [Tricholomella constricta]|uniref:Formamidase n=1 Tax=Tricholomella constricta TaxID=117010 RepID=A0A8H5M3W8_9AGAR|nr:hypothetical protein D9615_005795 [Tricholomella constricta]